MTKPPTLDPKTVSPRIGNVSPPELAAPLMGREKRALGNVFNLTQFGVNLTTLAPGTWSAHRHWHDNEDEFVFVVEGEITLIDDSGEHLLKPGMCAGFKAGVANGHHLVNKTKTSVTYLEIGTQAPQEQAHYSDVDMLYVRDGKTITVTRKSGEPF
ncbi:MAG TPA: cupin domain-containing protein [Aestuariivirga sp.]|nr:cupin domain-containing protein [Aestuariivirga sp.]